MAGFKRSAVADIGVIVSESGFTRQARDKAAQDGILLFELADLEQRVHAGADLRASARVAIAAAGSLRRQLQDSLRSPDRLTAFELSDLTADVTEVLDGLQEAFRLGSRQRPRSPETRPVLGALLRIQDASEFCLDALHHLRRVTEFVDESDRLGAAPGGTEADHTAAVFIRLRELDQARSQLRYRIQRLEEACRRTDVD